MVDMTLIRSLNEGQGHSFWYQSISHIRLHGLPIVGYLVLWDAPFSYNTFRTDGDGRSTVPIARLLVRSASENCKCLHRAVSSLLMWHVGINCRKAVMVYVEFSSLSF